MPKKMKPPARADQSYSPLISAPERHSNDRRDVEAVCMENLFSLLNYFCFFVIGLSMMWTWSMILQAVPFFHRRFRENPWILQYFQAFYLVFFAFTMLSITLVLGSQKSRPSYTSYLGSALIAYVVVATLLMLSTLTNLNMGANIYFVFTLAMVVITAVANGLSQNAAFAFAAGFGRTEYAPAIMTGEALAGLLPSSIEIASALAFPSAYFELDENNTGQTDYLTLNYFLSAVVVGLASLCAFKFLVGRAPTHFQPKTTKRTSNRTRMASKLKWPALANFMCLCISSVSPVFISKIVSVVPVERASIIFRPEAFIPLAIVLWNIGDLLGSVMAVHSLFLIRYPRLLFVLSLSRLVFIPLYLMCNIDGRGSVAGDWFYLIIVQFLFGLTHGWLSGASMMGVPVWINEEDREEAGAFMGMTLVAGLVAGSMLGLAAAQA
ncbi:nucleoside transporter-domain-containing protein [Hyaloscypha sp. PMI_1271]|nr:nucleoside transporter-domain-containing protein [Hyaloscypha sp. PMI_1271]